MCAGDISEAPYRAATADPEGPPDRSPAAYPASGSRGHPRGISRRQVLAGLAGAPIMALLPQLATGLTSARAASGVVRSALHVHTSFSEGSSGITGLASKATLASMESHIDALAALGFDLCFFTDHDHRMAGEGTGMRPVRYPGTEDLTAPHWRYVAERAGNPASGSARLTTGGLQASIVAGAAPGFQGMFVDCAPTGRDYRTTLAGVSLAFTMTHPTQGGWTEVRLRTSYHPARGGRAAGTYEIHYLFSPVAAGKSISVQGRTAMVTVPVVRGQRQRLVVTPVDDILAAFPDFGGLASDNGLYGIWIGVGAQAGSSASTLVTSFEILRSLDGPGSLALQRSVMDTIGGLYPSVSLGSGLEASYSTHLNLFGAPGAVKLLRPAVGESKGPYLTRLVREIHAAGGVASYNHPFGATIGTPVTGSARATKLTSTARALLGNGLYGCDVLEVGYERRGNMDVTGHLDLWDILLAAGLRVVANGVSDDHAGTMTSWTGGTNHYVTDVISPTRETGQVTGLLGGGRAFVSLRTAFGGLLDLACAGTSMGGTSNTTGSTAEVMVVANGLPTGSTLRVIQTRVHGDRSVTTPPPRLLDRSYSASSLTGGLVTVGVSNVRSYVRAEVISSTGSRIAFSNPLWLAPPG